jgi:heme/copper-type cytochrome/quinol oxidase subunit 3
MESEHGMNAITPVLFLSLFGLPTVFLLIWLVVRIWRAVPLLFRVSPVKVVLSVTVILLCSSGVWVYLAITALEMQIALTCTGGECAQGGMGIAFVTPVAWVSCAVSWIVARVIFSGWILPRLPLQVEGKDAA